MMSEASVVFKKLSQWPRQIEDGDLEILEKFVVIMYDRSSKAEVVDDASLELFARKQKLYEIVPLNKAALLQHAKHATLL